MVRWCSYGSLPCASGTGQDSVSGKAANGRCGVVYSTADGEYVSFSIHTVHICYEETVFFSTLEFPLPYDMPQFGLGNHTACLLLKWNNKALKLLSPSIDCRSVRWPLNYVGIFDRV